MREIHALDRLVRIGEYGTLLQLNRPDVPLNLMEVG
jgi:hypothetical protein